ncbi:hemA [Acrasis kona]|uniref:HemA n=1 Tax=Acrasis kona TaxID=1008807 RepID=A0AAW2Z9N7_9EUKA
MDSHNDEVSTLHELIKEHEEEEEYTVVNFNPQNPVGVFEFLSKMMKNIEAIVKTRSFTSINLGINNSTVDSLVDNLVSNTRSILIMITRLQNEDADPRLLVT